MHRRDLLKAATAGAACLLSGPSGAEDVTNRRSARARDARPNIVLIMADDMAFSDIGCYGSEIRTPNLDRLAANGLRFTQFYNTARCCPTRASLLTGLYAHQAGVGHMTEDRGPDNPGYRGHLNDRCLTIAEALKPVGYFTAVTGKWHVGSAQKDWWPLQRGFDRFFGVPQGGGFYFRPKKGRDVVLNNDVLYSVNAPPPADWYSTDAWTDYGVRFMEEALGQGKPFFLYVAHNAPHWPLQAPPDGIATYRGTYMTGWDRMREDRHRRMVEIGILDESWPLTPRDEAAKAWVELEPALEAKCDLGMAIYAAVVEHMDRSIGRLVSALETHGVLDDTLILFLSDNGGCAEGGTYVKGEQLETMGAADSFVQYGKAWANASNTPFRLYKHWVHEGGIATPLIAHWPRVIKQRGGLTHELGHVIDLMATCCHVAGATYPDRFRDKPIIPLEGKSLLPTLRGTRRPGHEAIYWEHEGNRAVRAGKWKLVSRGSPGAWELYDMVKDRAELHDLAPAQPERVKRLAARWQTWAARAHVLPRPGRRRDAPAT